MLFLLKKPPLCRDLRLNSQVIAWGLITNPRLIHHPELHSSDACELLIWSLLSDKQNGTHEWKKVGEDCHFKHIVMARTSQSRWGWEFLTQEKPAWTKAAFKWCCHFVPPQSCFSLLGQPHCELAEGTGLAKICLPVYLSKSYFSPSRLHFSQLNVRVNHSLIRVLTSPGSPFFLNLALIWLTTFPVLSFQKELITLPLVYLYFVHKKVSFNLCCQHWSPPACSAGSGKCVFPWDAEERAGRDHAQINILWTSIFLVIPSSNLWKKYWFSAWLIDKLSPHCLPLMKVWVTVFVCPQQENHMISFRAELFRGRRRWLLHPRE